ncbi:MAG: DUF1275 domain-containing protein [Xanthomonadaceae bacterium]|nr:DUF1275 domain-containing protein [Xanthomonadaceae bacterium]
MYRLDRKQFLETPRIAIWSALGFQAGFLNAFGFLAFGSFVSHVTGVGTQIGMAVGRNSIWYDFELLGFPLAFIFGSYISGVFTSARLDQGLAPKYDLVLFAIPAGLALMLYLGFHGAFGAFGEGLLVWHDFVFMYLLSFLCGLQNACIAVLTGGAIRTTHMTGISTDIGTDLSRILHGSLKSEELELTKKTNLTRLSIFISFAIGSVFSVIETKRLEFAALWIPLVSSLVLALAMTMIRRKLDRVWGKK